MGNRGEPPAGVPSAVTALAGPSWKVSLWTDPVPGYVHESCKHARGGVCGGSRATHLPFPHRKPTSLRSMLFILAPTAASWPPEGQTASSSSGMSWEVGPCAQASPMPSVQPHPRRAPWWVRAWGPCVFSPGTFWGQWPDDPWQEFWAYCFWEGQSPPPGVEACREGRVKLRWSLWGGGGATGLGPRAGPWGLPGQAT